MEHTLPYIDLRGVCEMDERLCLPSEVHMDADTRVRVFSTQLMDTVLENVTASNYLFHAGVYFTFGYKLMEKFPDRSTEITDATLIFWQKLQTKIKEMNK